jgi:hypothetical protein
LTAEQKDWDEIETQLNTLKKQLSGLNISDVIPEEEDPEIAQLSLEVDSLNEWFEQVPLAVDSLKWTLQMISTFQGRAKQYCEDYFRQIFEQISEIPSSAVGGNVSGGLVGTEINNLGVFTSKEKKKLEPMLILRALSRPVAVKEK